MNTTRVVGICCLVLLSAVLVYQAFQATGSGRSNTLDPSRLRSQAEAAERARDWTAARAAWLAFTHAAPGDVAGWLGAARACLALHRAQEADSLLQQAAETAPDRAEAWLPRMERLRTLSRSWDAWTLGWTAYRSVSPQQRPRILRSLTLATLAEAPQDQARSLLQNWLKADPTDAPAEIALIHRAIELPEPDDPPLNQRLVRLDQLVEAHPADSAGWEASVETLLLAGEVQRARAALDAWPAPQRETNPRYWRLLGRWEQDHGRDPEGAATAYRQALAAQPHDWKTLYRLARALRALGRLEESNQAAQRTRILRERLEPESLGPRLNHSLQHFEQISAQSELAKICSGLGLESLATAWTELAK